MVPLVAECLQDLQLLQEIGLNQEEVILVRDQLQTHTRTVTIKATVLIVKMRVSVISTIRTMTNRKDLNLPDLKCPTSMLVRLILEAIGGVHQSRSTSDRGKMDSHKLSLCSLNLTSVAKLSLKQLCLKWLVMRLHFQVVILSKDIKMMAMVVNTTKGRQINVARLLSKATAMTINRMGSYHHHEVHQRRKGQARRAFLVFPMGQSKALMVFPMAHLQMEESQELALCPSSHH
jgi:hypothetical protein